MTHSIRRILETFRIVHRVRAKSWTIPELTRRANWHADNKRTELAKHYHTVLFDLIGDDHNCPHK